MLEGMCAIDRPRPRLSDDVSASRLMDDAQGEL